jgi:hypothetical protein
MRIATQSRRYLAAQQGKYFLTAALVLTFLILNGSQNANALPAFARKYGLRCSACHESWPMLNYFGQKFKDNGYQLMNDRDSPIWQNPGYWPVTFRIIPIWHRVSTGKVPVDQGTGVARITTSGFDLSGLDFHTGGTLEKNFSFYVLPSSNNLAAFHFETVMARLDNLFGSGWLNIKLGKFELDNLLSEKRILTLTGNGGIYQLYHFTPFISPSAGREVNLFGQMGDNQLGAELMGHSYDDRTRYSIALLSSNNGQVGMPYGNAYTGFFAASQAFDAGKMGVDRIGGYAMIGQAATFYRTSGGGPIPGSGIGNKSFHREGFVGQFYFGQHVDLQVVTQHGWDNVWFGQGYGDPIDFPGAPNNTPGSTLPPGSQAPTWNGVLIEPHYVYSPQLIFIGRYETIRMSRQATAGNPSNLGNISDFTIGYRYNPFMNPRAGFAWHNEYNWMHTVGGFAPTGGNLNVSELLMGFDFDF